MKEETMGLEDTFKLTSKVMQVYFQQVLQEKEVNQSPHVLNLDLFHPKANQKYLKLFCATNQICSKKIGN